MCRVVARANLLITYAGFTAVPALSIGIRVYLLSSWCALRCRDLMWQAGRFVMQTNAMDKGCAAPWDDGHPVVVTIVVLTIISALLVTSAWLLLIGYGAWALLFH